MDIKKIICTTDFSDPAREALPHAVELARKFGAHITVLHVRTLFTDDPSNVEFQFLDEDMYEEFLDKNLEKAAKPISSDVEFETAVVRNVSPAAGILEYADEEAADLVVMGTHGRSALGHFFLGSVAEKVVRHAPCAVLTVGPEGQDHYIHKPDHAEILAPFDFSEHSIEAVGRALELARAFDANVHVLYVLEQEVHPAFFATWKLSVEQHLDEIRRNAVKALQEELGSETLEKIKVTVKIGDDRSDREISRYCRENDIDLVVMGTHGLSGIDRALLGSTTERVVRKAPCPVLTLKLR
ncbi:MAG TPA: universal stress protein [Acidobacteriota bacterium]|nr:universal stress protein [Acidobacteriota bacterium]